jgi:type VII secretion-associated serine protease mycosin
MGAGLVIAGPRPPVAAAASCTSETYPSTATSTVPWPQTRLGFERAWQITQGSGQTIAVIDSGVDTGNPQLPASAVVDGGDAVQGGSAIGDPVGHGTLVAGIIAARPEPGDGMAGVAPAARIYAVRAAECGTGISADAIAAAIRAAIPHASVMNISITTTQPNADLKNAVETAIADDVVVVAAAGNDQSQGNAPEYPAAYPGVLSVGAVNPDGTLAGFSSTGTPISVVAPGSDIYSTGGSVDGDTLVGGSSAQGTSFAAPYVAGTAALVRAAHRRLTAAQVVRRIEATADHPAGSLPSAEYGWGTVDPYAAVTAVLPDEANQGSKASTGGRLTPQSQRTQAAPATDRTGLWIATGALTGAVAIAGVAAAVPAGRRRRWRPAR